MKWMIMQPEGLRDLRHHLAWQQGQLTSEQMENVGYHLSAVPYDVMWVMRHMPKIGEIVGKHLSNLTAMYLKTSGLSEAYEPRLEFTSEPPPASAGTAVESTHSLPEQGTLPLKSLPKPSAGVGARDLKKHSSKINRSPKRRASSSLSSKATAVASSLASSSYGPISSKKGVRSPRLLEQNENRFEQEQVKPTTSFSPTVLKQPAKQNKQSLKLPSQGTRPLSERETRLLTALLSRPLTARVEKFRHGGVRASGRSYTDVSRNLTPAIQLDSNGPFDPHVSLTDPGPPAAELRDAIQADGERRIQLFFYQAVAFWQEGVHITIEKTYHQHGKGRAEWGTEGAHSAILPNLRDDHLDLLYNDIKLNGMTQLNAEKMRLFGFSAPQIESMSRELNPIEWNRFVRESEQINQTSVISRFTHFYHVLNATIELPGYINSYHGLFERSLRRVALKLLNEASLEDKHPNAILGEFVLKLDEFLAESYRQTSDKIERIKDLRADCERLELVASRISMNPPENPLTPEQLLLLDQYHAIAESIHTTICDIQELRSYSLSVKQWVQNIHNHVDVIRKRKSGTQELVDIYREIYPSLDLQPLTNAETTLVNTLTVNDILRKAAHEFPIEKLGGKVVSEYATEPSRQEMGGNIVPMTDDELLVQKYELLTPHLKKMPKPRAA